MRPGSASSSTRMRSRASAVTDGASAHLLPPGELFHVGVIVADVEASMAELAAQGYEWAAPMTTTIRVLRPDGSPASVPAVVTYSLRSPRLELLQAAPDTPWPPEQI